MQNYPSLEIQDFKTFCKKVDKIQEYVYNKKYYKNAGKTVEREVFLTHFNLIKWLKLPDNERKQHTFENCLPCNTIHLETSKIHQSIARSSVQVANMSEVLVQNMSTLVQPSTANVKANRTATALINVLNPLFEKEFKKSFEKCVADSLHLTPRETPSDKNNKIVTLLKENKNMICEASTINNADIENFLSSGKSYQQHDRERMLLFNTRNEAEQQKMSD